MRLRVQMGKRVWRRRAAQHRWPCIQPGCMAEALPRGRQEPPGSPFCPDHGWDTYRAAMIALGGGT